MSKKNVRFFIVNPGGAVHEVTKEDAATRLRQPGFRMAQAAEIEEYFRRPIQRADRPIAPRWNPQPEAAVEEDTPAELVQYEVAFAVPQQPAEPLTDVERLDLHPGLISALLAEGYDDIDKLADADDGDLLEIEGVGPATLEKIREAVNKFIGE
jgi:DNA-directed RNA polymerase alpha subunit